MTDKDLAWWAFLLGLFVLYLIACSVKDRYFPKRYTSKDMGKRESYSGSWSRPAGKWVGVQWHDPRGLSHEDRSSEKNKDT